MCLNGEKKKRRNNGFFWNPDFQFTSLSTGQCISRFTNRKVPYCVKFNPDEDKQSLFVAGMSDKKIVQVKDSEQSACVGRADALQFPCFEPELTGA